MSAFDNLKSLSFPVGGGATRRDEFVSFYAKEKQIFVLLSDIWRLSAMEGDKASVIGVYIKARGGDAARHFIFRGAQPDDALVSEAVACRMVTDWSGKEESDFFSIYPIQSIIAQARRAINGLQLIREIFEQAAERGSSMGFNAAGLRLEVARIADAMLSNWGRPGGGFPPLDKSQAAFLRRLTLQANEARRIDMVQERAIRFFKYSCDDVLDRIQADRASLKLTPGMPMP